MEPEKTNEEKRKFILNEIVKRKIFDMYNISKENTSPKVDPEDPNDKENQEP